MILNSLELYQINKQQGELFIIQISARIKSLLTNKENTTYLSKQLTCFGRVTKLFGFRTQRFIILINNDTLFIQIIILHI